MSNIYEITSFRGGLSDDEDKGIMGSFKFGSGLDIRKRKDTLSSGQALEEEGLFASRSPSLSASPSSSASSSASPSYSRSPSPTPSPSASQSPSVSVSLSPSATPSYSISPSPSPSGGITTVFRDLILFFVKCSDGYTYGFGNTGYIYRRDADGIWLQVYKDSNGKIKGACEKPSSNGKLWIYWATDRVLKRKQIPGRSDWNDAETVNTNLESADWHTMVQTAGGLKIANRDVLGLVGYDDSYTNEALDLIPGNFAKTLVERNGRVIVGTYRAADPNKGVNAAIDSEVPLAQVGDDGEIFFSNMSDSIPVKRFPGGGKCNPGGVANLIEQVNFFEWEENALSWIDKQSVGNLAIFGVFGADSGTNGIYSYGRKYKNHPFTLNLDHLMDVDEIGAVTVVDGTILASYQDGSSFGVKAVDADNKTEGVYEGLDFKAPIKKPIDITVWESAELTMAPLPSGSWVEFWYKLDKTGDFVRAYVMDGSTQRYSTASTKKVLFRIQRESQIFEPRIVIHPSGNQTPEIHRARIYFS